MAYSEYDPTSVSAPGETLKDVLEERGITPTQLGSQIGWSSEELDLVLDGESPITTGLAAELERALGTPAKFWLVREARYKEFRNAPILDPNHAEQWTGQKKEGG